MIKIRIALLLLLCTMVVFVFTGCENDSHSAKSKNDSLSAVFSQDELLSPYEQEFTITTVERLFGNMPIYKGSAYEELYSSYGINVDVEWYSDPTQYSSKVNAIIASGNIPDLMFVHEPQAMNTLVRSGMTTDIGPLLQYLTPEAKKFVTEGIGKDALESVTYDGKIALLPANITTLINNSHPLFIRKDWLDNLSLELPKTMEDFKQVALAFTQNDPDGNGKDDTYGVAIAGQTSLLNPGYGLFGFFGGYGVQPCMGYDGALFYSEDAYGNAVWDGESPRVKEGLQLLQDLYKAKAIPSDLPTMNESRVMEDLNGGKAGMVFGVRGFPIWAINKTILNNPEAEWYAINMPTAEGVDFAPVFASQPVNAVYAISADAEHPEAIMKMINVYIDATLPNSKNFNPTFTLSNEAGPYIVGGVSDPNREKEENLLFFEGYKAAESGDMTIFNENPNLMARYEKVKEYLETGDPTLWPFWNAFYPGPGHSWYLTFAENDESMIKKNLWWGLPTNSMVAYLPIYKKMAEETMTRIITGDADVSAWDKMVSDWNKLGGDIITEEVRNQLK